MSNGLSPTERAFLSTMRAVCRILVLPGMSRDTAVEMIRDHIRIPDGKASRAPSDTEIDTLIAKATEVIHSGDAAEIEFDKVRYAMSLEWFIETCRKYVIRKEIRKTKTRAEMTGNAAASGQGKPDLVETTSESQKDVFDPKIGTLMLNAMKELATVAGIRKRDEAPAVPASIQITNQILNMSPEELARQHFGQGTSLLPPAPQVGADDILGAPGAFPGVDPLEARLGPADDSGTR